MAQIAIPLLLIGTAYLASNDKSKKKEKEGFSELNDIRNRTGNLLANNNTRFAPNVDPTTLPTNNNETLSAYQDKYFLEKQEKMSDDDDSSTFQTLAGETVRFSDVKHNNMNVYYNNKSNGTGHQEYTSVLDNYTGSGSLDIKKEEVTSFFKQEDNLQNIYGMQNQSDFLQSRVNQSMSHNNTKPFESIQDTPGIGLGYEEGSQLGFNTGAMQREMWQPKTVDELRTDNNPKMVYRLDDHMGPAMQKVQNMGIQGKIVKRTPETFFKNDNNLGMIAGSAGYKESMQHSQQEINEQHRDTTSVEYFGVKGHGDENTSYVNGEYMDPHKQQLPANPFINFSNNNINPTSSSNYGKDSYTVLPNNRSTTKNSYFGAVGSIVSSIVTPIANGLRHTKKTNFVENKDNLGNVSGVAAKPRAVNPYEHTSTTNREMYEGKLSMNHLNVQKQNSTAYMNTRPVLETTNRSTMNQGETGPAMAANGALGNKSYTDVYNQRNINKLYASDVQSSGNMNLFNSNISMRTTDKEQCNNRATPFYNPQAQTYDSHPTQILGEFSSMPQKYEDRSSTFLDDSMLSAFKNNPYTQPLNSVA